MSKSGKHANQRNRARKPAGSGSATESVLERGDDRLVAALDPGNGPKELWVRCAELTFLAFALFVFYLGLRPGGVGPVYAYRYGQTVLGLLSLSIVIWGIVTCFRKPPFKRKGRIRALIAVTLVIGIGMNAFPYPSSRESDPSAVHFELPVEGEWRVYWGGEGNDANRYAGWFADRRWALALVRELDGSTHSGDGSKSTDYYAYGQPVVAPAAGRVVAITDGRPDRMPGERGSAEEPFGNHLVVEVAPGEYLYMCHLRAGSFQVSVGEEIELGQALAEVGNSGLSTVVIEPHLELHLQTTARDGLGEAIPWQFRDYRIGDRSVESGLPRGGVAADGRLLGDLVQRAPR